MTPEDARKLRRNDEVHICCRVERVDAEGHRVHVIWGEGAPRPHPYRTRVEAHDLRLPLPAPEAPE